jgi:hypothetical protein
MRLVRRRFDHFPNIAKLIARKYLHSANQRAKYHARTICWATRSVVNTSSRFDRFVKFFIFGHASILALPRVQVNKKETKESC